MTINLNRAALVAAYLHAHACTVGCEIDAGGECNADGLTDPDFAAASRLLYELDRLDAPARADHPARLASGETT